MAPAASYELRIDFERALNVDTVTRGTFLRDATVHESGTQIRLMCDPAPLPLMVDFRLTWQFASHALSGAEVDAILDRMRALSAQADREEKIFRGYACILLLHILRDLLAFVHAMERRGLRPERTLILYKDCPYPSAEAVKSTLIERGYSVHDPAVADRDSAEMIHAIEQFCGTHSDKIIVVEDGGYVLPAFHNAPQLEKYRHQVAGFVEQTTYGSRIAQEIAEQRTDAGEPALVAPLLDVARCEVKTTYEPPFVAQAAVKNIGNLLGKIDWQGVPVLVLGYGAIGRATARILHAEHADVHICETSATRLVLAQSERFPRVFRRAGEAISAVKPEMCIGTTGLCSMMAADVRALSAFGHDPVLVSFSSKQVEFDIDGMTDGARVEPWIVQSKNVGDRYTFSEGCSVCLLGWGYPINFVSTESVPDNRIDPIMTLLYVCAAEIAAPSVVKALTEGDPQARRVPSEAVDHILEDTRLFEPMLEKRV